MAITPVKISALPAAAPLDGAELVPVVQAGTTKKTTAAEIAALAGGGSVFVVNLAPIGSQTMNGQTYYEFIASEVLLASDDVSYVDAVESVSNGHLLFAANGTYEVQVAVRMSGDWPHQGVMDAQPAFYGLIAGGQDVAKFGRPIFLGAANDSQVGFCSQLVRQFEALDEFNIGTTASCYNFSSRTVLITSMQITVKKIGDYTP